VLGSGDLSLALFVSPDGVSLNRLSGNNLTGFFGPHQCLCPDTLLATVELTESGQANLGASTLTVQFLLGSNCLVAPAACLSVGQVSFSATQSAPAPTFDSSLVFQAVAGTTAVACSSPTIGMTTLWAAIAQDGYPLGFAPTLDLPVTAAVVPAPIAVTAQPASDGLLVSWTPPADNHLVAGYQVLCLPRPPSPAATGYESCGLIDETGALYLTPGDATQVCSDAVPAKTTSVRLHGLENGVVYTVAVVSIDASGGVSALSPAAQAIPQPTLGFYEKYKLDGGAASGCAFSLSPLGRSSRLVCIALALFALLLPLRWRRKRRSLASQGTRVLVLLLAASVPAQAQIPRYHASDDWAAVTPTSRGYVPPSWGMELGISLYRPAVDDELGNGARPFADTFSNARHLMSEGEVVRYLVHGIGALGVGLRVGYYKVTGAAFLEDGATRGGDETSLRLIPFALSLIYRATDLPGLRQVPIVPYAKAGLDGVWWTAGNTGASASRHGLSPGWHIAAGLILGLQFLGAGEIHPGAVAAPYGLFFEWDYSVINGLGMTNALHVGDSTWFAGVAFDL